MRWAGIILITGFVGVGSYGFCRCVDGEKLVLLYEGELRRTLFLAYLTLGGFLLSLKTFMVVKLKEGLYESNDYRAQYSQRRALRSDASYYGTLRRFGDLLFGSILLCLVAALAQYTLGLVGRPWSSAACISLCFCALVWLILSLFFTRRNLHKMFESCEADRREEVVAASR